MNVNTVGYILLAVGLTSILLSVVFWSSWAGPGYFSRTRERTVDESGENERHRSRHLVGGSAVDE